MSITDNDSQDTISIDETFFLVNADTKLTCSEAYNTLMQEVLNEAQEHTSRSTYDVNASVKENEIDSSGGRYIFNNMIYLGTCAIQKSNDALEINRYISDFSKRNRNNWKVSLSIPFVSGDSVRMYDQETEALLAEYPICQIGICTSGFNGQFSEYFGFSYLQSENTIVKDARQLVDDISTHLLECRVFKMKSPYYTNRILECFHRAFNSKSDMLIVQPSTIRSFTRNATVKYKLTLDIKEEDGKGNFVTVPKEDNQIFKLRSNIRKKFFIKLEQINGPLNLCIERCMGLFIGAGRYLSDVDMTLLEMESLGEITDKRDGFTISGEWNPCDKGFELLNCPRDKDPQVYMTVGISFCVQEVEAPLSLKIACKTKIFPESQRFWLNLKKSTIIHLRISLEEMSDPLTNCILIGKYSIKAVQYIFPDNIITTNCNRIVDDVPVKDSFGSDNEEPLKSGGGFVIKDVTTEQLMGQWSSMLMYWKSDSQSRPKELNDLVKLGIPDALRGEVWPLLASSLNKETELNDVYKIFLTKETKYDSVIKRDMPRIFTVHPLFSQKDGPGQEALFKVCKAYVLYDEEIGYCQSSAFLTASLLVHMSEERAFALLVTIMNNYKVRDMYKNSFEGLHICLYQLDNLMAEKLNDLYRHFTELQLESHMFANQWFMTLFTMKFHLGIVFHILDLFLYEGIVIIFKVALALLKLSRKELLTMDFEGALNYFRIALPKLYRKEEACKILIESALKIQISDTKLLRLEMEWRKIQDVRAESEDPLEILQKEIKKTKEEYNRLDQENDSLAKELLSSKISLQRIVDKLEENLEMSNKELFTTRKDLVDVLDKKEHLKIELKKIKDNFREDVQMREEKLKKQDNLIMEYKKTVSELSDRVEKAECRSVEDTGSRVVEHLTSMIRKCERSKDHVNSKDSSPEESPDIKRESNILCLTRADYWAQTDQINETELLLANTKLSLVDSQCAQQKLINEATYLRSIVNEQKEALDSSKVSIMKKFWNLSNKTAEQKPDLVVTWSQVPTQSLSQSEPKGGIFPRLMSQSFSQHFS